MDNFNKDFKRAEDIANGIESDLTKRNELQRLRKPTARVTGLL